MTRISALDVVDVRFPTSLGFDGSDAMNPEPDYSAAYIVLGLGRPRHRRLLVALHDRPRQRRGLRCGANAGAVRRRPRRRRADGRHRRVRPRAGLGRPTAVARTGEGRHAHGDRRGGQRRLGPALPHRGTAAVAAALVVEPGGDSSTRSTSVHRRRAHAGTRRWRSCGPPSRDERTAGNAAAKRTDYPAYTTSAGWLGYDDEKVAAPGPRGGGRRLHDDQAEGRRRPRRRTSAAARGPRAAGRDPYIAAIDANQRWGVDEAIDVDAAAGASTSRTGSRNRRRPTTCSATRRSAPGGRTRSGSRPASTWQNRVIFKQLLQAEAIDVVQIDACRVGGVNENLAILLLAAKFGVPVCPHAGGVGLCEMVQHLAMFDFVAVGGSTDGRVDRVRRPPARALRRTRGRVRRALPGTERSRGRRPDAGRRRSRSSASPTDRRGQPPSRPPDDRTGSMPTIICGTWRRARNRG